MVQKEERMWGELKLGQELTIEQFSKHGLKPICDVLQNKEANGVKTVHFCSVFEKGNYELFPLLCVHIGTYKTCFRDSETPVIPQV